MIVAKALVLLLLMPKELATGDVSPRFAWLWDICRLAIHYRIFRQSDTSGMSLPCFAAIPTRFMFDHRALTTRVCGDIRCVVRRKPFLNHPICKGQPKHS